MQPNDAWVKSPVSGEVFLQEQSGRSCCALTIQVGAEAKDPAGRGAGDKKGSLPSPAVGSENGLFPHIGWLIITGISGAITILKHMSSSMGRMTSQI